jgi:hypothetical protein
MIVSDLHIDVTQEDINVSTNGGATCPISQAVGRLYPNMRNVFTGPSSIFAPQHLAGPRRWVLPDAAMRFVSTYDCHGRDAVIPFSFVARQA